MQSEQYKRPPAEVWKHCIKIRILVLDKCSVLPEDSEIDMGTPLVVNSSCERGFTLWLQRRQ